MTAFVYLECINSVGEIKAQVREALAKQDWQNIIFFMDDRPIAHTSRFHGKRVLAIFHVDSVTGAIEPTPMTTEFFYETRIRNALLQARLAALHA